MRAPLSATASPHLRISERMCAPNSSGEALESGLPAPF